MLEPIAYRKRVESILEKLPYVTKNDPKYLWYCDAWTSSGKCHNKGEFHFKKSSTKGKGRHKSGDYCVMHIRRPIEYSVYERARAERAFNKAVRNENS